MKKKLILLILFTSLLTLPYAKASTPDLAICTPSSINNYVGLYSIDYLIHYKGESTSDFRNDYFKDMFSLWETLTFHHDKNFASRAQVYFQNQFININKSDNYFYWDTSEIELPIKEIQKITNLLPKNCQENQINSIEFYSSSQSGLFEYNKGIIEKLKADNYLQFSFIMLRHFLEIYSDNFIDVSHLNYQLHLKLRNDYGKKDSELSHLILKLITNSSIKKSVCDKNYWIKDTIERTLHMNCEDISQANLDNLNDLTIKETIPNEMIDLHQKNLFHYDFSNLENLESLTFKNNYWIGQLLYPGVFHKLKRLKRLTFDKVSLYSLLNPNIFLGISNLEKLSLRNNVFSTKLHPQVLANLFSEEGTLEIKNSNIEILKSKTLQKIPNLKHIIFEDARCEVNINFFKQLPDLESIKIINSNDDCKLESSQDSSHEIKLKSLKSLNITKSGVSFLEILKNDLAPNLESLSISNSGFQPRYIPSLFRKGNKLKVLNISKNNFDFPFITSEFKILKNLEELIIEDSWRTGMNISSFSVDDHLENIPKSLRILKLCHKRFPFSYIKDWYKNVQNERSQLKIYSKDHCKGEWREI